MELERSRSRPAGGPQRSSRGHGAKFNHVLTLQRQAGNRATAQMLLREPSHASRLVTAAKRLGVEVDEPDIHLALRVRAGVDDGVRPGLNIVANLAARGRTGFVDSNGRYRGDFLTAARDGVLPSVAIMLGPLPFAEGDDSVLGTLRHELIHAQHDRMVLDWLGRWRAVGAGNLLAWMRRQKASPVDLALVSASAAGNAADTELLAHIEGFAVVFDTTPAPSPKVVLNASLPLAIEQLRGAAARGWSGVDRAVKAAAGKRLAEFYGGLDAPRQALLREWLFYLRNRATTPWPKDATDDEARAARVIWQLFHPHAAFLEWLHKIVGAVNDRDHLP